MDSRLQALLEPKKKDVNSKRSSSKVQASAARASPSSPTSISSLKGGGSNSTAPRSYDPRALLNPKGERSRRDIDRSTKSTPTMNLKSENDISLFQQAGSGPRTMLENLYGVEQRNERPVKRVKLSPTAETEGSKSLHTAHGSAGIVGEYMRPKADENLKPVAVEHLVDLTNDDDNNVSDDDIKLIKSVNLADEQEVCFGMLYTLAHVHAVPKPHKDLFALPNQWPLIACALYRIKSDNNIIELKDTSGFKFGRLAPELASVLAPLMDVLSKLRTSARISNRQRRKDEWHHQACSDKLKMTIVIYGRRADAERLGKVLGQQNIWLKQPYKVDVGIPLVNPHQDRRPVVQQNFAGTSHVYVNEGRTLEEATQAVSKLFDHFANTSKPLAETDPPAVIISPLMSHQKQALTFMLAKESPRTYGPREEDYSSLWRKKIRANGTVTYEELVSGVHIKDEPPQVYGGLLADVMGLGKTLEALSLIATTMGEAHTFGKQKLIRSDDTEVSLATHSRATLIVAPVSTVKNWEDQITEHMRPDAVRYYVYHGPGREKNPFKLADYDIVISTYGTISAECNKKKGLSSPIQQIRWFRIVLDEAHTIREPKASQSQAMYGLFAERRWALTGTPIQNRIDDLGSLTRFLRLYPYDTTARFSQYIKGPVLSKDINHLKALRIFVDSFTLRRLKDRIDLPKRQDIVEKLDFSTDEKKLHDFFKSLSLAQVKQIETNKKPVGKLPGMQHSQILRGIMTLRLISAHGRELLKDKDLEKLKGQSIEEAIDVDDEKVSTITERAAYENLALMAEAGLDICKNCDRRISGDSPRVDEDIGGIRAYVLPCLDVLCAECFQQIKDEVDRMHDRQHFPCPYCSLTVAAQYITIDKSVDDVLEQAADVSISQEYKQGDYQGPHTKTRTLLQDLHQIHTESQTLTSRGEPPIKCVIFSEFTSHLNLIERALDDHHYRHVRIDGTMSLAKRKRVLDELNQNDNITILLASIKAAGQGLNLTAASRAFIMEPLWNPAAEAQAVDRIYRIGQKREVVIKRYQMNDSIEMKIVELQVKKQKLADLTVNKNHQALSKRETREEHMRDLLNLFK